jgi:hypothetical protein
MPYLVRRILDVLADVRSDRLVLRVDDYELRQDLDLVVVRGDGSVDLNSCTPLLRSFARAYQLARAHVTGPAGGAHEAPAVPTPEELSAANRDYFAQLQDTFVALTGQSPEDFGKVGDGSNFSEAVRKLGAKLSSDKKRQTKLAKAAPAAIAALQATMVRTNLTRTRGARALQGSKLVLGGNQRFNGAALAAARSMLLYTDTVLIADPVLPWFETSRAEERFRWPQILEQIFYLCRLKPLVDASLPYPAVCIFPSWEKLLEDKDPVTQDGIELLLLRLFSHFADATFEDFDEVIAFGIRYPAKFAEVVTKNRLFIPPEGEGSEDFGTALSMYKESMRTWRSADFIEHMEQLPDVVLATVAIQERLGPQFHVLENADMLSASPLFSLPVHWHYFQLLETAGVASLANSGTIKPETTAVLQALSKPTNAWLGNVPINDLVELRKRLDNEHFRRQLDNHIKDLGGASEATIDQISARVGRGLAKMLVEQEKAIQQITEDYSKRHLQTAVGGWITAAACFMPWFPLAPAAAALSVGSKYVYEKATQIYSYKKQTRTLLGILAAAANTKKPA